MKNLKEILNKESKIKPIIQNISNTISNKPKVNTEPNIKNKTYIKTRFKMPDRRKGYIQKVSIGEHKVYLHTGNKWKNW